MKSRKRSLRSLLLTTVVALGIASSLSAQLRLPRPSPKSTVSQTVGVTDVTISYSRPGVKNRVIWGELVPWDAVWRTGANEATTIAFSTDVMVEGNKLAAGTYSLHTIPGKSEWTLIFNSVSDQWGSYSYDAAKDVLRVKVKPQTEAEPSEMLTFDFPTVKADSAEVALLWEKIKVPFTVKVDTNALALAHARTAIKEAKADDWRTPYQAANYSMQYEANWSDARGWVDKSISTQENAQNLSLKARMLAKEGKTAEAIAAGEKSIKLGQAATPKVDTTATEKLVAEWKGASKKK